MKKKTATSLITKQLIKRQQKWKGKKKIFHSLIYLHQVAEKKKVMKMEKGRFCVNRAIDYIIYKLFFLHTSSNDCM